MEVLDKKLLLRVDHMYAFFKIMSVVCLAVLFPFSQNAHAAEARKLKVVSSFSILADIIKNVGQDRIRLKSIVGPNGDTHVYEPTPKDSLLIADADIIFINGLSFETWFNRLVEASGYKGPIVIASEGIAAHKMIDPYLSDKIVPDPHVWGNVQHVMVWVKNIRDAFITYDPDYAEVYTKNAADYLKELKALDLWIHSKFKGVPPKDCKVITAHDAFNYYEKAYGIRFLSPQGISTVDEPSASDMVELITQIKKEGIKTIFVENISNQKLIQQLSSETGAKIGGTLYSDALSPIGESGETYIKMMKSNTNMIRGALTCTKQAKEIAKNREQKAPDTLKIKIADEKTSAP